MPHRIDIGDGQTIRQNGVFEPHLEAAAELKPDVVHATPTILQNPMQNIIPENASKNKIVRGKKVYERIYLATLKSKTVGKLIIF